jgi:UDP-N-acetyl-D-mannosaminuronic acid dehydrogenase
MGNPGLPERIMSAFSYEIVIVGGLGHVGLPLGIALANTGKKVALYDIDLEKIELVKKGNIPFIENGAKEQLKKVLGKNLFVTSDRSIISNGKFIILALGTPVDEHLNPEFSHFNKCITDILKYISDDQHIIIRSTIFPGTTEKLIRFLRKNGKNTKVSFCPERISEGKAMEELRMLPQIISGTDSASCEQAKQLFLSLTKEIIVLSPKEAELAKLFTNTWRYLLFAISNQFYQIATQNGLDFYNIYDAATYNYPRLKAFPKAGFAAGPCLFKDTMQLAAYSNNNFFLGHAAMLINEGLPNFMVQQLLEKEVLADMVVGILGMAFKADIDDARESLSYKLQKILSREAKQVLCTDPYVNDPTLVPLEEVLSKSDIIIIGAPHSVYQKLDFSSMKVVDVWGNWRSK